MNNDDLKKLRKHYPILFLCLLTLAVYGQTLGHDFLSNWDDNLYITGNEAVQGISIAHLKSAFTSIFVGNYAPVQIVSYMLDYSIWGTQARGFHLTNLILHAVNGLLLYCVVFRFCRRRAWAFSTAAVFLLHPVQVESVAWLSQRKNLLSMSFFLSSVLCYGVYRYRPTGRTILPYALAIAFFGLALLAKPIAVILPLVLLLVDYCCESSPQRKGLWADKVPFLLLAAAMAVVTMVVQSPEMGGGRTGFHGDSALGTFFTMQTVLARYLWMLFWPLDLSPLYHPPFKWSMDVDVALAMLLVAALFAGGVILLRRNRLMFFGFAVFFVALLPVSQIVPLVTLMNDRYLYFPLIGFSWLAGGIVCCLMDMGKAWLRQTAAIVCALLMAGLTVVSYQRVAVWKNSVTLWSDTVAKLPESWEVRAALAEAQVDAGMIPDALKTYAEVFRLSSDYVDPLLEIKALNNAAVLHMNRGSYDLALSLLQRLVEKFPEYPLGFFNLGINFRMMKNLEAAETACRKALALQPGNIQTLTMLGDISLQTGRLPAAREYLNQAMANGGNSPSLQFYFACLEAKSQNNAKALEHLGQALQLGYSDFEALDSNPALSQLRQLAGYRQLLQLYMPGRVR